MEKLIKTIKKIFNNEEIIIGALGDSLTYGWMTERGFLDFLKDLLIKKYPDISFKIYNRGVPGDTAGDGLRRLDRDIIRFNPDLVMIQFGLNDAYSGISPDQFSRTIDIIISKVREKTDSEIALLTSVALADPRENSFAEKFYDKIVSLGIRHDIPVATVHDYWKKKISEGIIHSTLVQLDGVHPTERGYRLMAESIFDLF